jgi:ATP-dependent Clp protease ATP-binding subunit ClpA
MFERYTENARRTIFDAKHEAHRRGHREVKTEHLLLALLQDSDLLDHTLNGGSADIFLAEILAHLPEGEELPKRIDLLANESVQRLS